jgi:ligand-binding sensor domain-containing protein/two-component sensor histidine kinase
MEDREGGLWVATDDGLYYNNLSKDDAVFNVMLNRERQINPTNIAELRNKEIIITTWGNGVMRFNQNLSELPPLFNSKEKNYQPMTWCAWEQKSTNKLFIGCQGGGLIIYDLLTKQETFINDTIFNGKTIRQITGDDKGNIYLGTQYGRIIKYTGGKFSLLAETSSTIIQKLLLDNNGLLWAATFNDGLYVINPSTGVVVKHFLHNPKNASTLYSNIIRDVLQYNDSLIYVSSLALSVINKNNWAVTNITTGEGLPSNTVNSLVLDSKRNLWLTTVNGIVRYSPITRAFTVYGNNDGIIKSESLDGRPVLLSNGDLVFNGTNQLVLIMPERLMMEAAPPDVTVTDFRLLDKYLPLDSLMKVGIALKHYENSFAVSFASLSYQQRGKLIYYYMLEGVDKEWIQGDFSQSVRYSLLPPGKYNFLVKCKNNEGIQSKGVTRLSIRIIPPFWRTGWFASTVLFFIALLIYTLHNLRVTRLLAVEKLRNRVARDLHDDMGSTLSTINILSSMAKAKIATDTIKTSEYINKISDNSQRMMEAMDDIVWAIKPANDTMQKIVARMREFATSVLEAKEMDIEFTVDETVQDVALDMEQRRDLFLLFKEAVNNVAKYSKCKKAGIALLVKDKKLQLVVADDGVGFDTKKADSGNGLGNMLKRADALRGRVEITSKPGNGTEVKLTVPL